MERQHTTRKTNGTQYAILIVDMLNDFIHGKLKCEMAKKIIPKIKSLVEVAKSNNIPIFFCNDAHLPTDDYEFKLWGPHALKGSRGARVINELKPYEMAELVPKRTYSAFYETKLDSLFKKRFGTKGPDVVIIAGIHTNICTKHTAYDAFVRGFDVLVPEDAVAAIHEKDHKYALNYMKKHYGARILKTSRIVDLLSKYKPRP